MNIKQLLTALWAVVFPLALFAQENKTHTLSGVVLSEDREGTIHFMAASYVTLYRRQYNITRGRLITAVPVTPEIERKMRQKVESRTKGTVEFQTEVDPEIIGGYILEYDTYRLDASIQNQLRNILTQLR